MTALPRSSVCSPGRSMMDTCPLTGPWAFAAEIAANSAASTVVATFVTAFGVVICLPLFSMPLRRTKVSLRVIGGIMILVTGVVSPVAAQDSTRLRVDSLAEALKQAQVRLDA